MLAPRTRAFNALVPAADAWHVGAMRLALACGVALALATPAAAHVTVSPARSDAGGTERYTVLVPTEGDSPTIRIEVRVPTGVDVAAIEAKPGWEGVYNAFPLGAATLRWSGGRIPPGQMMSFDFLVVNPPAPRVLTWNATQWYEDGSSDRWGEGAPADHEASTTTLVAAAGEVHAAHGHATGAPPAAGAQQNASPAATPAGRHQEPARGETGRSDGSAAAVWIALAAFVVATCALAVAVTGRRRQSG